MGQSDDNERTELAVNPLYMMEGMEALKSTPLFKDLNGTELKRLFQTGERRPFEEGEELVKKGEILEALWVIVSGRVELSRPDGSGELGPGGFFGERGLVDSVPSNLSCRAVAEGEALRFPRHEVMKLYKAQPVIAVKMLSGLLHNAYKAMDAAAEEE